MQGSPLKDPVISAFGVVVIHPGPWLDPLSSLEQVSSLILFQLEPGVKDKVFLVKARLVKVIMVESV